MFELKNIVRKNILDLQAYSSARDEFKGKAGIFLDANENPYGHLNRYPDPNQSELKTALSELKKVDTKNIFIGNGSDEAIDLVYRIFCKPGVDKALTFSPTYGMYEVSAGINNVELIKIPLDASFQIDTKKIENYLSDYTLKLIFICSPNNPTGNVMDKSAIRFILNNFNGIVVVDEAYSDFSSQDSLVKDISKHPNLIVCQTFSKAWGLASARVGVAYANEAIIQLFSKVKPPYNVSSLNQQAALEALRNLDEFEMRNKLIISSKSKLIKVLEELPLIEKIYPSDANFILVKVTDADKVYNDLIDKKIIVRNRHKLVENCIRISIGKPQESLKLIEELKKM